MKIDNDDEVVPASVYADLIRRAINEAKKIQRDNMKKTTKTKGKKIKY